MIGQTGWKGRPSLSFPRNNLIDAVGGQRDLRRRAIVLAFGAIMCWTTPVFASDRTENASEFVRALGAKVITILSDETRDKVARRAALRAVFLESFDTAALARFTLGRHWRIATEAQKARYLDLLPTYVADIYAGRLSAYAGEVFVVLRERPSDTDRWLVNAQIRHPDGSTLKIDFRLRQRNKFHVFDVLVAGISLVITKRDEFATVIRHKGLDGLLTLLEQRTRSMIAG